MRIHEKTAALSELAQPLDYVEGYDFFDELRAEQNDIIYSDHPDSMIIDVQEDDYMDLD